MTTYVYSTINVPGEPRTLGGGINNSGTVVGAYDVGDQYSQHAGPGFIYTSGTFTDVHSPTGGNPVLTSISNNGQIVGS